MLQRLLMSCFAAGLLLTLPNGCSDTRERRVRAPKAGVQLRYALSTGTSLEGHLRIGTTRQIEGLKQELTQAIECDARLFVMTTSEDGSVVMRATFRNVILDWSVPPEEGLSSDAFAKLAATELRSLELQFSLSPRGKITAMPHGPDRPPPELVGLLDTLGLAVISGFVELPATPIRPGHRWSDMPEDPQRTVGVPKIDATFEGLVQTKGSDVPLAIIEQRFEGSRTVDTDTGGRRRQVQGTTTLRLDSTGVPAQIDTQLQDFDPDRGLAVQELHAQWALSAAGDEGVTDVQDIEDPCDPDYVGSEQCASRQGPDEATTPPS